MQDYRLTVDKFLDHAAKWRGDREIVEADAGVIRRRVTYRALRDRSNRLSGALRWLGLTPGDRIGTLAWNGQHHLEIYYAAMGMGLVCHTLNPRMNAAGLATMVNDAEDRVLAVSASLLPLACEIAPLCPGLQHVILLDDAPTTVPVINGVDVWSCDALRDAHGAPSVWGDFDENAAAGLCYTSGTTGAPKGVVYTHRSNYLHTLRALQADVLGLVGSDVVLLAVPMFHANGWGVPFSAPAVGAKLVLPGRHTDGKSLATLMRDEGVTIAIGVHTVWLGVLDHLDQVGGTLPDLERIMIGGSNCAASVIQRMEERLDIRVQTSWGMTELSPTGTVAPLDVQERGSHSGRPAMGLDLKLTDANGVTLSEQRGVVGHLRVKGPSVVERYFKADADALDDEGYFDTGDLATIDDAGNLTICGRSKDLIKSGGEWINPAEIEALVGADDTIVAAAVIGRPDARWGERPVLVVVTRQGQEVDVGALLQRLRGRIADWWLPDQVVRIPAMPLAATGKIDKNQLRTDYVSGKFEDAIRGR